MNSNVSKIENSILTFKNEIDVEKSVYANMIIVSTGYISNHINSQLSKSSLSNFIEVDQYLRVINEHDVFASGDCCTYTHNLNSLKGGVNSYFAGPILAHNIKCKLESLPLSKYKSYHPTNNFLVLMNTSDGEAIGFKWGLVLHGRWVAKWKDYIDKKFMRKFNLK